ncbi:thiamine pyrophosphate-requiring protein [Dactylosporangium aurantiacum]|uniref:Thiamine pyrophosphate-requiring protein n=1 Tax=Dactylosporangium aurantiacum TaxID=35754 RepID=A0A9Q9MKJ0_9ACTN|nr:thiamine pyrophosphate-requiring protein [Dactylosporangium aurantiacum]MDG6105784.1 thiamine pyrophosphate-requiring protein [Dactylosporangium aurantiacum]UWZ58030.1 thiamine pyrophosphate-requiring protein [Dactylosporangium aurantiacum]
MTQRTVSDVLVERLTAWGVERVFGYAGDGIDGVLGALRRAGRPEFVQARHEETAAFMAVGHAKYTGGVGVCLSTQGPGAVHLLNGLYDAKLDGKPVVAIVGQQVSTVLGSAYQQEIDLVRLFGDVCAQFVQQAHTPQQVPMLLDRAFRTAVAARGPTCVILPHDVQGAPAPDPAAHEHGVLVTSPGLRPARVIPFEEDLRAAAELLGAGRRVAILVGQGGAGAADEIAELAERLGAGVAASLLGKPVLDEGLPFHTGVLGHLGTTASTELMRGCDTLLLVGTNDPWTEFYPRPGQARAVQIDIDGRRLGVRYPVEVPLLGDARPTLRALLDLLPAATDRSWQRRVTAWTREWHELAAARAAAPAEPMNPQHVIRSLSARLPHDAQVSVDVGSVVYWYARHLRLPPGVPAHLSSTLASMGSALPYGLAAKLARPDRPVIALAGDGAMQMNGLAELVTVAARRHDWADPRFVVCVLNNRDLAEVSWEQREMEGEPRFDASQRLPDVPYARWAELLGLRGVRVSGPAELDAAWDAALSADGPFVIDAVVDPATPLLPPLQDLEKVRPMYAGLAAEDTDLARRAAAYLRRERAGEGFDDPN